MRIHLWGDRPSENVPKTYGTLLGLAAKDTGVDPDGAVVDVEERIVDRLFTNFLSTLPEAQREEFRSTVGAMTAAPRRQSLGVGVGVAAATMVVAQASGFGVYLMASTVVGSITGMLGASLPFAFYTAMSKAIAVVISPVGWLVLAGAALLKLAAACKPLSVQARTVAVLACIRARLSVEHADGMAERADRVAALRAQCEQLETALAIASRADARRVFGE